MGLKIELGGRSYDMPPFMLAELEAAAPHIDRMNELFPEFQSAILDKRSLPLTTQTQLLRAMVEILAVGLRNVDPDMTAETIMRTVNFTFMGSLGTAVQELLRSSGMTALGEVKAPSARPRKGAKASKGR